MLIQRFGAALQYDEDFINEFIKMVKSNPGSCDAVWFATPYGYPKMETHAENGKKMLETAQKLRKEGMGVSIQLSNSIGHGEYVKYSSDCSGLIYDGTPARGLVGHDGTKTDSCFCWRDTYFKEYLCNQLKEYLVINPDYLWIDDDFRAKNHGLIKFGCYCDDCIKTFNEENNFSYSREELVEEMLHGDIKIREKYLNFIKKGLYDLMLEISKFVHKHSPNTVIGLQNGANGAYPCHGLGYLLDAIKEGTGKTGAYRAGGGAYSDNDLKEFTDKAAYISFQNSTLPEDVTLKYPEIENTPFVAFGKTPAGISFETALYFANGATGMTYSMMMQLRENYKWHNDAFNLLSKNRKYYDALIECNKASYQSGIRYFASENCSAKPLGKEDGFVQLAFENEVGALLLSYDGVPISYDKKWDKLLFLHGDTASSLSCDEIEALLSKNVITDGKTIATLKEKGYDIGIESTKMSPSEAGAVSEIYTEHSVNNVEFKINKISRFTPGSIDAYFMSVSNHSAEIIGKYEIFADFEGRGKEFFEDNNVSTVIVTTPNGGKWAVLAYMPWKGVRSSSDRNRLMNIADYISGGAIPAKIIEPVKSLILPRTDNDGKTVCVSIINPTIGDLEKFTLTIRNPKSDKFVFMAQDTEAAELKYDKIGNDYNITIPKLKAWNVGTVFCV